MILNKTLNKIQSSVCYNSIPYIQKKASKKHSEISTDFVQAHTYHCGRGSHITVAEDKSGDQSNNY